jgi:hypothetical protein
MQIEQKPNGFTIVKLHYSDHPLKTDEWVNAVKRSYPSEDMWNQEQELDFTKQIGRRAYPFFQKFHIKELQHNPYKHILRGWDFGYHHPACVFAQVNDKDQLLVLREIIGTNQTLVEFAKSVRAISKEHYSTKFDDYCDPSGRAKSDKNERTSVDILRTFGIRCRMKDTSVINGLNLIRQLLLKRDDGEHGFYIDPGCTNLIDGFFGGYSLKENSEDPDKDGWYEHLFDALRYTAVNVFDERHFSPVRPVFPWAKKRDVDDVTGY